MRMHPLQVAKALLSDDEVLWVVLWSQGLLRAGGIRMKTRHCATKVAGTLYNLFTIATGLKEWKSAVVDGLPDDERSLVFASGDLHLGVFNRGEPDGRSAYSSANGSKHVGRWKRGKKPVPGAFR